MNRSHDHVEVMLMVVMSTSCWKAFKCHFLTLWRSKQSNTKSI